MGRTPHWSGVHRYNLLNMSVQELAKKYPAYSREHIRASKHYWQQKLINGEITMPEAPRESVDMTPVEGRLTKRWSVSAYDHAAGEWTEAWNESYDMSPQVEDLSKLYEPSPPAKITPTKRKRAERVGRQILVFGDSQIGYHRVYNADGSDELIPTHSEPALSVVTQINAHERPEFVVNVSDTVDLAEFGRFDPQSDSFHRTLSPAFQRAHNLYAQLRADNPDAELIEVDSNHTARVHKNLMKKMPEMYGFTLPGEEYPLMSYYRLANLGALGVRFISGYGGAQYVHGEENGTPIVFRHGNHSSSSPGATVRKEASQNPTTHVVRGHGHSYEHIAQTTRSGEVLHYIQLGTTCETTGAVPSYHSAIDDFGRPVRNQERWQNQLMIIEDFENGTYNFNVVDIINGQANFRGVHYDGNQ